ncbi:BnaC03g42300D [Brassica napus]|uniref:BnaC03g42300D protein n=1 Tax=Brassica napus TaxID=3708 RepID=A0A078GGG6_BRANA|nr:BnaC03g42300D [Brassica napus]
MEEIPSHIIVSETSLESGGNSLAFMYTPTHGSPFHNYIEQFNVHDVGDELMSDATTNLNMSRGARPIKPSQKYQDMDWTRIREKCKRGRRGRGYPTP